MTERDREGGGAHEWKSLNQSINQSNPLYSTLSFYSIVLSSANE